MTMNYRGEFEKLFPVPPGVKWCERQQDYTYENYRNLYAATSYSSEWKVWQAALAQSGQSEGAIAEVVSVSPMDCTAIVKWRPELNGNVPQAIWNLGTKLYTHPQPAQQGGVPEGWRECLQEMVQAMHDYEMSVDEAAPYKHRAMMDRAHALLSTPTTPQDDGWKVKFMQIMSEIYSDLDDEHEDPIPSDLWDLWRDLRAATQPTAPQVDGWKLVPVEPTTEMRYAYHEAYQRYLEGSIPSPDGQWWAMLDAAPQPEGNGWVKCSERLPTEEDQYVWVYFKDHGVSEYLWRWDDDIGAYGETHWMPTGLKFPQPPQEGEW